MTSETSDASRGREEASVPGSPAESGLFGTLMLCLLLWSSSFPGIKASLEGYPPLELTAFRFLVASLVLAVGCLRNAVRMPERRHIPSVLGIGLGCVGYHITLNYGETKATAGAAAFIVSTAPVFTCVLAWLFLGEAIHWYAWAGIGISLAGVWVIALTHGGVSAMGVGAICLLLAAAGWGVLTIIQKRLLAVYTPWEVCCYSVWIGALSLVFVLPATAAAMQSAPRRATLAAIYLGVFPTTIASVLWWYVLAHWPASRTAIYTYLIPLFSTVVSFVWLKEVPGFLFLAGGATVLAGVAVATRSKTR